MKKNLIDDKDEKIRKTLSTLPTTFSLEDFIGKFKEHNPTDFKRLDEKYRGEERNSRNREWKKNTMPTPEKYISKAIREYVKLHAAILKEGKNNTFTKIS